MFQAEKNAVTASFLSGYAEVVLGVIVERLNNCATKDYHHGLRALKLLEQLIINGSVRVYTLALSLLPLLRHLVMPTVHSASVCGEWIATVPGSCLVVWLCDFDDEVCLWLCRLANTC